MSRKIRTHLYRGGILLLSILGVVIILVRQTNYGVGLMVDSLTHTSTAESLLRGEGFVTAWNNRLQQGQPPLYALWLSLFATLDVVNRDSVIVYARYAGAIIFGLTILASIIWIAIRVKSRTMIIMGGAICAFSPFLGNLFSLALTETLFILLTVLSLLILDRFLTKNNRSLLILAASFSSLAWLTRHMGITVIISSILVLSTRNESTFRQRFNNIVVYSSISILPSSLWMLRNYLLLGQFSERRWSTGFDWITSLNLISSEVAKWLVGTTGLNYLNKLSRIFGIHIALFRIVFLGFIVASIGFSLTYLYRKGIRVDTRGLIVPVLFISVYSVVMITSLILTDIDVEMRYLSPIYVPMVVATVMILGKYYTYIFPTDQSMRFPSSKQAYTRINKLKFVIISSLSIHLVLAVSSSYSQVSLWKEQGFGYLSKPWTDSETIRFLKSNLIGGQIYSNEARALYTHINVSGELEVYLYQLQAELPDEARYWDDNARAGNFEMYVVWFHGWRPFIQTQYDFVRLIFLQDLEIVMVLEDGIVLRASNDLTTSRQITDVKGAEGLVLEAILDDTQFIASSDFNVYLDSRGTKLIYISSSCNDTNVEDTFFLHIFPTHDADIPKHRRPSDFNNYDFRFDREGFRFGEQCAIIRNLPDYDIKMIRTGQFNTDEVKLWEESFDPRNS